MEFKDIDNMDNASLVALTEEEIVSLAKLSVLKEGGQLPILPTVEEPAPIVYECSDKCVQISEMVVRPEVAEAIQKIVYEADVFYKSYNETSYKVVSKNSYNYPDFKQILAQTPQEAHDFALATVRQKAQREVYNEQLEAYTEAQKAYEKAYETVTKRVWEARADKAAQQRVQQAWEEMVELANGDKEIAKAFFLRSYSQASFDSLEV